MNKTTTPLKVKRIFAYEFENGARVSLTVEGDAATEDVLWVIDELMTHKRREIASKDTANAR